MRAVSRVDQIQADGTIAGPIHGRAWEVTGDIMSGTAKLHIGAAFNDAIAGDTLALNGYGVYDTTTNLIPDEFVALVLARARAEAYRRVAGDRVKFKAWLARNQEQNVSVPELLQYVHEAETEAERLEKMLPRTWMKPVPGRVG